MSNFFEIHDIFGLVDKVKPLTPTRRVLPNLGMMSFVPPVKVGKATFDSR
jgi:hypothetical protein